MNILFGITGFIAMWLAHLLPNGIILVGTLTWYGIVLANFFFRSPRIRPTPLLIGTTIAQELFGSARLGIATFILALILTLTYLFNERFKATSLFIRFTLSLVVLYIGYTLCYLPITSWLGALPYLVLSLGITALISYPRSLTHSPFREDLLS